MAIVDADTSARKGWTMAALAGAFLRGGATLLQVRDKAGASRSLLEGALTIVAAARTAGAAVIVNDRADIAALSGADGVHVGQDDLPPALVRRIVGGQSIVGLSTHTPEQLDAALGQPLSYAAIGPIFGTDTKATGYRPLGLDAVRRAAAATRQSGVPLVAIGGITLDTAPAVIDAGAQTVAVIADLLAADPADRVRTYVERLGL
jgi:thiamine-phosphate pyrophosphorylase